MGGCEMGGCETGGCETRGCGTGGCEMGGCETGGCETGGCTVERRAGVGNMVVCVAESEEALAVVRVQTSAAEASVVEVRVWDVCVTVLDNTGWEVEE